MGALFSFLLATTPFDPGSIQDPVDRSILYRFASAADNAVAALARQWIADQVASVPFRPVTPTDDGKYKPILDHPAAIAVEWGSDFYDGTALITRITSDAIDSDGFAQKAKDQYGSVAELWWRDRERMTPVARSGDPLKFWKYEYENGVSPDYIARKDIIQVKHDIHPIDPRRGRPFYRAVFRELDADSEISRMLVEILRNSLMPRAIFEWRKEDDSVKDEEEDDMLEQAIIGTFGRGRRGASSVTGSGELIIHQIAQQIGDLGVTEHRRNFEARIMAAFKVHPLVIGLDAGMQYSAYNNLEVAERASWTKGVIPVMGMLERAFTQQYLWQDFEDEEKKGIYFQFDREIINDLREDVAAKLERERIWNEKLEKGGVKLSEYRKANNLPWEGEEYDVYYLPVQTHAVVKASELDKLDISMQYGRTLAEGNEPKTPSSKELREGPVEENEDDRV